MYAFIRQKLPDGFTVSLTVRQNQTCAFITLHHLLHHIPGNQCVPGRVLGQFGEHPGVFRHRIRARQKMGFPQKYVGRENIPGLHKTRLVDLVGKIAQVPEDELGELVPPPGGRGKAEHVSAVKGSDRLCEGS